MEHLKSHEFSGEMQLLEDGMYKKAPFNFVLILAEDSDDSVLDEAARSIAFFIAEDAPDASMN